MASAVEGDESGDDRDTSRILALTDGVVAIAITLLVLDLAVPDNLSGSTEEQAAAINDALANQAANFFALALSFLVIGVFWIGHRQAYRRVTRVDGLLLWLNLAFLGAVGLMPFTTRLLAEYGNVFVPTMIYAVNVGVVALTLAAINVHVSLQDGRTLAVALAESGTLDAALVFFLSIPIAAVNPNAGKLFWAALFVTGPLSHRLVSAARSRETGGR